MQPLQKKNSKRLTHMIRLSFTTLLAGAFSIPAAQSPTCTHLAIQCLEIPCAIYLDSPRQQALPTPWKTDCLEPGEHSLELRPNPPAWTPARIAWRADSPTDYRIVHTPFLRTGALSRQIQQPGAWKLGAAMGYQTDSRLDIGYGIARPVAFMAHLARANEHPASTGLGATLSIHNAIRSLIAGISWWQLRGTYEGGHLEAALEFNQPFASIALRETAQLPLPALKIQNEIGISRPFTRWIPEGLFYSSLPLRKGEWQREDYSLGVGAQIHTEIQEWLALDFNVQSPGWPRGPLSIRIALSYQHQPPVRPLQKPLALAPPFTDTAWLAEVHALYSISPQEALSIGNREKLPRPLQWIEQMQALRSDSAKPSPICRENESMRLGLCLSEHCGEWLRPQSPASKMITRGGILGIPNSCLQFPEKPEVVPIEKIEIGKSRRWNPVIQSIFTN